MRKIKQITLTLFIFVTIVVFSVMGKTVSESVKSSLELCFFAVIPSLFPFFILSEFLMQIVSCASKRVTVTAFATGLLTGFPAGVNNVCRLYEQKTIDKSTATSLLYCTANASPAYVVTFIGTHIIKSKQAGVALLIAQIITAFACAVFFRCFKNTESKSCGVIHISEAISKAITSSVINCLYVCGYIVLFGILADIVSGFTGVIVNARIKSIIIGAIEITRGMETIDFRENGAIVTAAIILGFSGISVIMQCINCAIKAGLSPKPIITGKLIYTFIMPGIAYIIYKLMPKASNNTFKGSENIWSVITVIAFLLLCVVAIYNIFDKSKEKLYNREKITERTNDIFKRYNTNVSLLRARQKNHDNR